MRRQILLWGLTQEQPLNAVRDELIRREMPYLLVDQRQTHRMHVDFDTSHAASGRLRLGAQQIALDDIGAIFMRPHDIRAVLRRQGDMPGTQSHAQAMAVDRGLFVWTDITNAYVINRPSAMAWHGTKLSQAETIREHGFETLPTLTTDAPEDAHGLIAAHGQVIYKLVSGQRSVVSCVDPVQFEQTGDLAVHPMQFHAHVPGVDWRVHVVGDAVHACEVRCRSEGSRNAHRHGEAIEVRAAVLPPSVEMRCHAMARHLNLPLAGIDLRRTENDVWYCFGINTAPVFTRYECPTGQSLTAAVVQLLIDACRSGAT